MAEVSRQLTRISRIMAWLSLAGAVVYLLLDAGTFLIPDTLNATGLFEAHHLGHRVSGAVPLADRLAAFAVDLIPTGLVVWAFIELYGLFGCYAHGEVFSERAFRALKRISALIFAQVWVAFFAEAPISYLLSLGHPPGHREISLTFTSYDVSSLFIAGAVLAIARVMAEARHVADENESFV